MKLISYTAKKGYLTNSTTKSADGSYSKTEDSAEVAMTFEGDDLDPKELNETVRKWANDLKDDDPDWIKNREPKETPHQQSISGEMGGAGIGHRSTDAK